MLLTGILSVLQMILLPGLVFCNIIKFRNTSPVQKGLYIFSFSLYLNYVTVTLLVLFSIYYAVTVWAIILAETVYLFTVYRKKIFLTGTGRDVQYYFSLLINIFKLNKGNSKLLLTAAAFVVLFYAAAVLGNAGTVFYFIDTVNNYEWNKWAIDFSNNIFPKYSSHFPQLLPANWSLCYVLTGYPDIHFFPKVIMPLFILGIILMFADLSINRNNLHYLAALIIYGLFAPVVFSLVFIMDGNADLPVAFFSFLAFYSFVKSHSKKGDILEDKKVHIKEFVFPLAGSGGEGYAVSFLFATMAAATKLAGFYTFSVACVLLLLSYMYSRKQTRKSIIVKTGIVLIVSCCISLFWYIKAPEVMYSGLHQPEYVAPDYADTFLNALSLMYFHWGAPVFVFFTITVIASLFHKRIFYVSVIMVIMPLLLWMFKYSPDFRNLSFVIPFMCLCSAAGLYKIAEFIIPRGKPVDNILLSFNDTELPVRSGIPARVLNLLLLSVSAAGIILFVFSLSDSFYYIISSAYEFIHKYYYKSNRILYFVDFTLILHAEFYQRVLTAFFVVIVTAPLIILFRIKTKQIIISAVIIITILSFYITKADIIQYQVHSYNKIDAHNYYNLISTVLKEKETSKIVFTNFKEITDNRLPGKVLFIYSDNILNLLSSRIDNRIIFLKLDAEGENTGEKVSDAIKNYKYKILLSDDRYILFSAE